MSEPLVACMMLVSGNRPEMLARAVRSYNAQTYSRRILVSWPGDGGLSVGTYRNEANAAAKLEGADIICHFDDDDLSHANRVAEQVALLESSGADAVGYREVMFWRTPAERDRAAFAELAARGGFDANAGQAWLFTHPQQNWCHGASLCYWRSSWERKPFPDLMQGEDLVWQAGLKRAAASAMVGPQMAWELLDCEPRLICGLHGANTSARIVAGAPEWLRVADWDARVRAIMETK